MGLTGAGAAEDTAAAAQARMQTLFCVVCVGLEEAKPFAHGGPSGCREIRLCGFVLLGSWACMR